MKYISVILLLNLFQIFAQENYQIDTINQQQRDNYAKHYHKSNEQLIAHIKNDYSKQVVKKLKNNINEFVNSFEQKIKEGDFIFDKRFLSKANEILAEFENQNKSIPKNLTVLISKDPSLNAYCLPDGTFVINMGLFYWLDNESQLAGVIAHELSHYLLNHTIKLQVKKITEEQGSQAKKRIKKIKKNRYNKVSSAFELYKNQLYALSKNRRKKEIEADSLGYVIMKHTKYNEAELIRALQLMKMYDTIRPIGLRKEIYKRVFNLPKQKFNEDWLKCEDFSSYKYGLYKDQFNKDSIASHPETLRRIKKLQHLELQNKQVKKTKESPSFKELKKITEYNFIPSLMYFKRYGMSIYLCLKQIQAGNDEEYYKMLLGKNFKKILEARKKYQLNRYLERVDPKNQSDSYIQFLNFMWNLSLSEIENITEHYKTVNNH